MTAHQLVITPAVRRDIDDIYQYGLHRWGRAQSERYLDTLKNLFWSLTEQPLIGTERPDLLAGIRSITIESHVLFYRVTANRIELIRVLHGRQDPGRHVN